MRTVSKIATTAVVLVAVAAVGTMNAVGADNSRLLTQPGEAV